MSQGTYELVRTTHIIAMVLWISGLTAVYWMLRFHDHAPKSVHEQLTLQERALALSADIAAAVTIGCGLALVFAPSQGGNLLTAEKAGWLHIKLAAVVLMVLPVHGMLRAKIKKYGLGQIAPVPTWMWSLLLGGITISIFCVSTKLHVFYDR